MKTTPYWHLLSLLVAASLCNTGIAQQSIPLEKVGSTKLDWTPHKSRPAWIATPRRDAGKFSFSTDGHGSAHQMAIIRATRACQSRVRSALHDHLVPALGEEAANKVLSVMLKHVQLVETVYLPTRDAPGTKPATQPPTVGPGEFFTVGAAYMRWEMVVRDVVIELDPALQGRVEWLLLHDIVTWQSVREQPQWVTAAPQKSGRYRFVLTSNGSTPTKAQAASIKNARSNAEEHLQAILAPIVGKEYAHKAAQSARNRLAPIQRSRWTRWTKDQEERSVQQNSAYVLWEIPTSVIADALPEKMREPALAALAVTASKTR